MSWPSDVKDVFTVSAPVCWEDDTVLNDVFAVDWDAGNALNERAIPNEGFLNTDGSDLFAAEAGGKAAGCFSFEVFVNFEDFPFTVEPSERRFRLGLCKER